MSLSDPGPVLRWVFRAPIRLYDRGFGWLLGRRLLCLTHIGRKSGRRYRTVLEVVGTAAATGETMVVAGFGPSSDWYRNIQANPASEVVVGRRRFQPQHRVLDESEAETVIADYERRNRWIRPIVRRGLSALLGWRYDGSHAARQRLVRQLPVVAFRPRDERDSAAG
ncbi:MAG: nitroreductase family deazaflavin-dependent oxidoreductase [Mycobacterium sp.]